MVLARMLLIAFNVAVVTYLVFRMFWVYKDPIENNKKVMILITGVLLLVAPFSIFFGIIRPSALYFLIYPVVISLFLFLIREVR